MSIFNHITCPFCSLHCFDLNLDIRNGNLVSCAPGCPLAFREYAKSLKDLEVSQLSVPSIEIEQDILKAASWLNEASQPLVIISSSSSQEAACSTVKLAKKLDAILCTDRGQLTEALNTAMVSTGLISATLGEIETQKNLVFIGLEDDKIPRFEESITSNQEKNILRIEKHPSMDEIRQWRQEMNNSTGNPDKSASRWPDNAIDQIKGAILFGERGILDNTQEIIEFLLWVRQMDEQGTWYGTPIISDPNLNGITETFLSLIGFCDRIKFSNGNVKFNPYLYRPNELIKNKQVDCVLLVGGTTGIELIKDNDSNIHTIQINSCNQIKKNGIWLPSALPGLDDGGQMARLDNVLVSMKPLIQSNRLPVGKVLDNLVDSVKAC
jgi:formylmethanofuran dehydrogenase subunit B